MTRNELEQKLLSHINLFKGHTDGRWYETGQNAYMCAEFSNIGQAAMFANRTIWDLQVGCSLMGGDWDDPTQTAQVIIKPRLSARM